MRSTKKLTRAARARRCRLNHHCYHDLGNNRRVCCVCGRMEVHVEVMVRASGHGRFAPPESHSRWEHVGYATTGMLRPRRDE